jgi:predicted transcriptional regulator
VLLVKEHAHRVLVVERGKLVGIVSTLDVARCVSEAL